MRKVKMINIELLYNMADISKIRLNDIIMLVYEIQKTIEYYLNKNKNLDYIKCYTEDNILYPQFCKNLENESDIEKMEKLYSELFEILVY